MKIDIVEDITEFKKLQPEWNRLVKKSFFDNPFLTFEWFESWLDIFGDEGKLFIVVVRDENELTALAPLFLRHNRTISFIGYPQNDYAGIIASPGSPEAVSSIAAVLRDKKGLWKRVTLDQISQQDKSFDLLLQGLGTAGLPFRIEPSDKCPAMTLEDLEMAKKMYYKRNITSYVNWFKKEGDFKYNIYSEPAIAMTRLENLFEQHIARWQGTATPSYFRDERMKRFYRRFLENMHPLGMIHFSSLTLDTTFLALYISLEYGQKLYFYKTCFNLEYAKKSPGQVILRYHLDYALEKGLLELDFARGDEGYKDRFANVVRENRRLVIYSNQLNKTAAQLFYDFRYSKLADILYRNSFVQNWKKRLLSLRNRRN